MHKHIPFFRDLCMLFMSISYLCVVYAYIYEIGQNRPVTSALPFIYIATMIIIDYLLRTSIRNIFVFFGCYLLLFPFIFIFRFEAIDQLCLTTLGVFIMIFAKSFWTAEVNDDKPNVLEIPVELSVVLIAIYFHSYYSLSNLLTTSIFIVGIVFILGYVIKTYLSNFIVFISHNNTSSMPLQHIFRSNNSYIILIIVFLVTVILLLNTMSPEHNFSYIRIGMEYIIKLFLLLTVLFTKLSPNKDNEEFTPSTIGEAENNDDFFEYNMASDNPIIQAIVNLIGLIIMVAIAIAIFYTIYSFIKQYLHRHTKNSVLDQAEDLKPLSKNKLKKRVFKNTEKVQTNNARIRKLFYKRVKRSEKLAYVNIKDSFTPYEICSRINDSEQVSLDELTNIYEKARYSDMEVTKQDIIKAKEQCR